MKTRKILAAVLAIGIVLSMGAGCSRQNTNQAATDSNETKPGTFPIVKQKITLHITAPVSVNQAKPYGDLDVIQQYEKKTNVHVEWNEIPEEGYAEKYKLMLASDDLPDAFGSGFSYDSNVIYKYAQDGTILPLDDIIDKVSVNIKKYFSKRPDFKKLTVYPDGHIYTLPSIDENQNIRVGNTFMVNETFLSKLGMPEPKTYEDIENYLKAATSQDLNGDGKKETGLTAVAATNAPSSLRLLFGCFGIAWDAGTYINQSSSGKLQFAPAMPQYKQALQYFNKWYKEGLIDPEIFTQNNQQLKAKAKTAGVSAALVQDYLVSLNDGDESKNKYRPTNMPQNSSNDAVWVRAGALPGYSGNQFFLTKENKYPDETIRYIDYWMDNSANALNMRFGPENYSWKTLDGGKWTETTNIPTGELRTWQNSTLHCTFGYGIPYWCFADKWSQKVITQPQALQRQAVTASYCPSSVSGLPTLVYEAGDSKQAISIQADLFSYVDSQMALFITKGITDQDWNNYIAKLKSYKSDTWVSLYQKYYDKMNAQD